MACALLELQRRFWQDWHQKRFDRTRVFLLEHHSLKTDFKQQMTELLNWLGVEMTEDLHRKILEQTKRQTEFKSGHSYTAEEFGLDPEDLESQAQWINKIRTV